MSFWIFLFCVLAFPATLGWIANIVELNDGELAEIKEKCALKSHEDMPEKQLHDVLKKPAAPNGQYPFMAFVGNDKQFLCGAVFISRRHLLTVRDCLRMPRRTGLPISVYTGGVCYGESGVHCNTGADMKEIAIDVVIFDGQEWGSDSRDLAIVQILSTTSSYNSVISQIDFACLPEKNDHLPSSAVVVGWGRMHFSMPPKHLQHAPIELNSAVDEANFFGRLSHPKETVPNFENNRARTFAEFGSNSSAGNAVVSYSAERKRYVLNGLILGSSWSSRFGRTFSDGVKVAPFHADLCRRLRLCVCGVDRISTVPKLKMVSGYSPREKGSGAAYGFAGGYAEEHGTTDGRFCHQEMTDTVSEYGQNDTRLAHYNAPGGYVNIDGQVNETDTIRFDLGNAWDLSSSSDEWYKASYRPQLSLKVCVKHYMSLTGQMYCPNGLVFCWRNGFGDKGQKGAERDPDIDSICQKSGDRDWYNGMRITYTENIYTGFTTFNLSFLHTKGEKLITTNVQWDGCWHFRFIKWHQNMSKYNFGIFAAENPSFLPFIKIDGESLGGLQSIRMKVVGSQDCGLFARLESDYATPCYYKWAPMKMGSCGNEGGYNPLTCERGTSTKMSRSVVTRDVRKGVMDQEQFQEYNNITEQTSEAVHTMVTKTAEEHTKSVEKTFTESLEQTIETSGFGFTVEESGKISRELTEKVSTKFASSFTKSLTEKATKKVTTKVQTVKTLESVKKSCDEKVEEINKSSQVERFYNETATAGSYVEQCGMQYVCGGKDEVINNDTPFSINHTHPPRDDNFT